MTISQYAAVAVIVFAGSSLVLHALDIRDRRRQRTRTVDAYLDHLAAPRPVEPPPIDPTEPIPTLATGSTLTGRHRPHTEETAQ